MKSATAGTSHGTATNTGTAIGDSQQTSETLTEVLNILPCHEQLFPLAQAALRRPRLQGNVRYEGSGVVLQFAPAVEFGAYLCGVPVLAHFLDAQRGHFESRAVAPSPYDPHGLFLSSTVAMSASPADETAPLTPGASTPASTAPKRPIARGRSDRNKH
jgi:hypothetical protein